MSIALETILKELSFVLPDVNVQDVNLTEIMQFDMHDLQGQFQKDLIYISFFEMLQVEIGRLLKTKENQLQDLEGTIGEEKRSMDPKPAETRIKSLIQQDARWRSLRDEISHLDYQLNTVRTTVSALNRKGIALNVLTAKMRAEIGAKI